MKKIILTIFMLLGFGSLALANDVSSQIKSNYEYVDMSNEDMNTLNQLYISNKGNKFYFWGSLQVVDVKSTNEINAFLSQYKKDNTVFLLQKEGWMAFVKSENNFDVNVCNKISLNEKILFDAYPDIMHISNPKTIFGKNDAGITCYVNGSNLYVTQNQYEFTDMHYMVNNFQKLKDTISKINIYTFGGDRSVNVLKSLYKYVQDKTSYNYDVVSKDPNGMQDDEYFPRRIQGFFDGKKIVCGGYSLVYAFLANLWGYDAHVTLGDMQSMDKKKRNLGAFGHGRVQIGNKYFDPTFDDSEDKTSYDYFAKSKTCFNLDHYVTGWVSFADTTDRFNYIKTNLDALVGECPKMLLNVVIDDNKEASLIKLMLENYDIDTNKRFLCDEFELCNIQASSKDDLLEYLKLIVIKKDSREINLGYSIGSVAYKSDKTILSQNDQIPNLTKVLDMNSKLSINNVLQSLKSKYKGKDISKIYDIYKPKISSLSNSKNIGLEKQLKLRYLDSIFLVENLK